MKIGKIGVAVIGLVPFNVYGECTPTPDCASIGYTETSCEGDYLACPFDSTKLKCIPCDSSYRYNCSGDNITGGTGSACGGKYVNCECAEDTFFDNGICACDTSCKVGAIYYSDGTCSSCVDSNKTAIGVVVKDNELVISKVRSTGMQWSSSYTDVLGLTEIADSTVAKQDFKGKANTLAIIETFPDDSIDNNAAVNCNSYSTEGTNIGDWYLPAAGELYNYMHSNFDIVMVSMNKIGWNLGYNYFWSSSEANSHNAWNVSSNDGNLVGNLKGHSKGCVCFFAI